MSEKTKNSLKFHYIRAETVDPPITKVDGRGQFVKYDEDNLYPQFLASLTLQSTTHASFIELKSRAIAGLGVQMLKPDGTPWVEAQAWFDKWNACDIDDTKVEKMAKDLAKYSGISLLAEWNKAKVISETAKINNEQTPTTIIEQAGASFDYTCFKDWRSGVPDADEEVHEYFYSKQWAKSNPAYNIVGSFNPDNVVFKNDKGQVEEQDEQLLYYFKKNDNSDVYPIPSYVAAVYQILAEGLLAKSGYNAIVNGFQADGILVVPMVDGENAKEELEKNIRNATTGVDNVRKVLVMMTDGGEDTQKPEWIPINSTDNPDMRALMSTQYAQEISTVHGSTSPSLVGLKGSTGFASDANEMIIAYNYFNFKEIEPDQKIITRLLENYIIRYSAPKEFLTAKVEIVPLKFEEMLGFKDEQTEPAI
jgi:hypothetical protein